MLQLQWVFLGNVAMHLCESWINTMKVHKRFFKSWEVMERSDPRTCNATDTYRLEPIVLQSCSPFQIWHKACFKCQECNMTLSMRNYKGFDKLPYCGAHVPKAKATVIADTPENRWGNIVKFRRAWGLYQSVQYFSSLQATGGELKFAVQCEIPRRVRGGEGQIHSNRRRPRNPEDQG